MAGTIISELDFNQIKNQLKTFLQGQAQFADYDYDGVMNGLDQCPDTPITEVSEVNGVGCSPSQIAG